jgi:hypothetical protein
VVDWDPIGSTCMKRRAARRPHGLITTGIRYAPPPTPSTHMSSSSSSFSSSSFSSSSSSSTPSSLSSSDLRSALGVFYAVSTAPEERARVDAFLNEVRRNPANLPIALDLLDDDPRVPASSSSMLFSALMLCRLLQNQSDALADEVATGLRAKLLAIVQRLQGLLQAPEVVGSTLYSPISNILRSACRAFSLSCLFCLGTTPSNEVVRGVGESFPSATSPAALLAILTTLPEEAAVYRQPWFTERMRNDFLSGLREMGSEVVDLLSSLLEAALAPAHAGEPTHTSLACRAMECMAQWVAEPGIAPSKLASAPIFDLCLSCLLTSDAHFVASTDVLLRIVQSYTSESRDLPVIGPVLVKLLSMRAVYQRCLEDGDEAQIGKLTTLFAEAGMHYHSIIILKMGGADFEAGKASFTQLMCDVTDHGADIMEATGGFWYELERSVFDLDSRAEDGVPEDAALIAALRQQLIPMLTPVIDRVLLAMKLPEYMGSLEKERQDAFLAKRARMEEILVSLGCIVGPEVLVGALQKRLGEEWAVWISTPHPDNNWSGLEASFSALVACCNILSPHEGMLLPTLFGGLPTLPPNHFIKLQSYKLIKSFSNWLGKNLDLASSMFTLLLDSGVLPTAASAATASSSASTAAAAAITPLASLSQRIASSSLSSLLSMCLPMTRDLVAELPSRINLVALHPSNAIDLLRPICRAIAMLPAGAHETVVAGLLSPFASRLDLLASDPGGGVVAAAADGTLLSALTHDDGTPNMNSRVLRRLGISKEAAFALIKGGEAAGGVIDTASLGAFPSAKAIAGLLVERQLSLITTIFAKCLIEDRATIALALGFALPQDVGLNVSRSDEDYAAINAVVESAGPAIDACRASCNGALIHSFRLLWPILETLSTSYADQSNFFWKLGDLFNEFFDVTTRSAPLESIVSLLPDMMQASKALNSIVQGDNSFLRFNRKVIQALPSTTANLPDMWTASAEMLQAVTEKVKAAPDVMEAVNGHLIDDVVDAFSLATALLRKEPDAFLQLANVQEIVQVSSGSSCCSFGGG